MSFNDQKGRVLPEPLSFRQGTPSQTKYVIGIIFISKEDTYYNYKILFNFINHLTCILTATKHNFVSISINIL